MPLAARVSLASAGDERDSTMRTYPLEPDPSTTEIMGRAALSFAMDFLAARPSARANGVDDQTWALSNRLLAASPPEAGTSFDELLAVLGEASERAIDTTGPGYMAFIPGGGLYATAIASFLTAITNRFVPIAHLAPALAAIEASVGRWLCDLFGYGLGSQAVLTSGGSMANFSAIVAARAHMLGEHFSGGVLYVTEHSHRSVTKGALLAGFPASAIRTVACTSDLAMDADALVEAIEADRASGRSPFMVVATAGTTSTGAIDPIARVADVAESEQLWLHVDAAYGGFFQLTQRGRACFTGIERADTITLDPHKGMFLPYGTGCLLARDGERLRRANQIEAHYLQDVAEGHGIPNLSDYSLELTREARGLRVWLPLYLHGVGAFRAALDEKMDLAQVVYQKLAADDRLDVPWKPALSTVAFRLHTGDDKANRLLLERINSSGRVFLSSTAVENRFTLRVCVLSHRTHSDRVNEAIEIIRQAIDPE